MSFWSLKTPVWCFLLLPVFFLLHSYICFFGNRFWHGIPHHAFGSSGVFDHVSPGNIGGAGKAPLFNTYISQVKQANKQIQELVTYIPRKNLSTGTGEHQRRQYVSNCI
jgi:hypothetical protein